MGTMSGPDEPAPSDPHPDHAAPEEPEPWRGPVSSRARRAAAKGGSDLIPRSQGEAKGSGAERALGAIVALAGAAFLVAYYLLPVVEAGPGFSPTLADITFTAGDVGVTVQTLVAVSLGLAVVVRPRLGPGVVAMSVLTLPWLGRSAVVLFDLSVDASVGFVVISATSAVVCVASVVALALAVLRLLSDRGQPAARRVSPAGAAAAFFVGAVGMVATFGVGWYRLVDQSEGLVPVEQIPIPFDLGPLGHLLDADTWTGRMSWLGLLLALAGLALAVASRGPTRRAGGIVLLALMVTEALRRGVLPAEDLIPSFLDDFAPGVYTVELRPVGLLVPLLGAAVGAWLLTGSGLPPAEAGPVPEAPGDGERASEAHAMSPPAAPPLALPDHPGDGPPSAWPPTAGTDARG
ncbi:hypothetical protein BH24ACT4_BH24ACT4_22880 [soil metagenome]